MNLKTSNNPDSDPSQNHPPQPDARAQAAMPWLSPPPASTQAAPHETVEPQSKPATQNDPGDPDAKNLPPGVALPDAALFRLGQIKSQIVNFSLMTLFILLWSVLVLRDNPTIGIICTSLAAAGLALACLRFWLARRHYLKQQNL